MHDDVHLYFETETVATKKTTHEKGYSRIEKREYFLETEIDWLYGRECFAGLMAIGAVKSTVTIKDKTTEDKFKKLPQTRRLGFFFS